MYLGLPGGRVQVVAGGEVVAVRWVSVVRRPVWSNVHDVQYGYLPDPAIAPPDGAAAQSSTAV